MTHQLNLMHARLLPPRRLPVASLPGAALLAGAVVAAAAGVVHWQNASLREQAAALEAETARLGRRAAGAESDRTVVVDALRVRALAEEAWVQKVGGPGAAVPDAMAASMPASRWLTALGGTAGEGAWLTEVRIVSEGRVAATGRAVDGAALHAHLARWRAVPELAGLPLGTLDVRPAEGADGHLEFRLAPGTTP